MNVIQKRFFLFFCGIIIAQCFFLPVSMFAFNDLCIQKDRLDEYEVSYVQTLHSRLQNNPNLDDIKTDLRRIACEYDRLCKSVYDAYFDQESYPLLGCKEFEPLKTPPPLSCSYTPTTVTEAQSLLRSCSEYTSLKMKTLIRFTQMEIDIFTDSIESSKIDMMFRSIVSTLNRIGASFNTLRIKLANIYESITCRCDP